MPLLAQLTQLEKLNLLYCTQITGKGFESLTALTGLQELKLMGDHVDDQVVSQLAKFQALRELVLLNTRVTGAGIDGLGALPEFSPAVSVRARPRCRRRLYERNLGLIVLGHAERRCSRREMVNCYFPLWGGIGRRCQRRIDARQGDAGRSADPGVAVGRAA